MYMSQAALWRSILQILICTGSVGVTFRVLGVLLADEPLGGSIENSEKSSREHAMYSDTVLSTA